MKKIFTPLLIAVRAKTLTASICPILVGTSLSYEIGSFNLVIFFFTIMSAIFIQIGTNFANDVYDFLKGADNDKRLGPKRAVQSSLISVGQMKLFTLVAFFLSVLFGIPLIMKGGTPILLIGVAGIISGYMYTGGPYPLGYNGWGDLFVFIFFGPVAVCGTFYLQSDFISIYSLIVGIIMGSLSVCLLCINNIRDAKTDREVGKRTIAVRFSPQYVRYLFIFLLLKSYLLNLILMYSLVGLNLGVILFFLSFYLCYKMIFDILKLDGKELNPMLLSISSYTLLYSVLFIISLNI